MRSLSSRPIGPFSAVSMLILLVLSVFLPACRPRARVLPLGPAAGPGGGPPPGYQVQAGAFSLEDNAARLTRSLREQGWNAFYLYHETRVFKVRIGPFRTREKAVEAAGFDYESAEVEFVSQFDQSVDDRETVEKLFKLIDAIEDVADVQTVWSNEDVPDEILEELDADG